MKKILTLLLFATLLVSCSSDDDDIKQDYTSFVFYYTANVDKLPNCIVGYKKDGKYIKLAELGDLIKGQQSSEIRVNDNSITEIYIFTDYMGTVMFDDTYILKKNTKNIIKIKDGTKGIEVTDKTDPTQYPQ